MAQLLSTLIVSSCHQYIQSRLHPLVKMLLILCLPFIAATDEKGVVKREHFDGSVYRHRFVMTTSHSSRALAQK